MAKNSKATKTDAPVVTASAPTTTVTASASTTETKAKKPKAVKQEVAAPTPTPAPVVVAPTVTASSSAGETTDTETPLAEQSMEFFAKLQQMGTLISSLKTEYRTLEKKWTRELKAAQKMSSKRKRKTGNRAPSGFVKPTRISDELATFLGKESGAEMARTAVTRDINAYIRENKLQDTSNGRKINPDAKLTALLKLQKADELTYFNLQRFMSCHFAKSVKATKSEATATA